MNTPKKFPPPVFVSRCQSSTKHCIRDTSKLQYMKDKHFYGQLSGYCQNKALTDTSTGHLHSTETDILNSTSV